MRYRYLAVFTVIRQALALAFQILFSKQKFLHKSVRFYMAPVGLLFLDTLLKGHYRISAVNSISDLALPTIQYRPKWTETMHTSA